MQTNVVSDYFIFCKSTFKDAVNALLVAKRMQMFCTWSRGTVSNELFN